MFDNLTRRQNEVLDFILDFMKENRRDPSMQEIAAHFGFHVSTAYDHVSRLVDAGALAEGTGKKHPSMPMDEKVLEEWQKYACMGYTLLAMSKSGFSEMDTERVVRTLQSLLFDDEPVDPMEAFSEGFYHSQAMGVRKDV